MSDFDLTHSPVKAVYDLRHRWLRQRADLEALAAATAERDADDTTRDGRSLSSSKFMMEREANAKVDGEGGGGANLVSLPFSFAHPTQPNPAPSNAMHPSNPIQPNPTQPMQPNPAQNAPRPPLHPPPPPPPPTKAALAKLVPNGALLQPVNAYTPVQVCLFCAQFFDDDEGYRPSYTGKLEAMLTEADKEDEHEEARFWDPLTNPYVGWKWVVGGGGAWSTAATDHEGSTA